MIRNMMDKIRGVLAKMGIIKEIKRISDVKEIAIDDKYYSLIGEWFDIYKGYLPRWHDKMVHSIGGTRKDRIFTLNMGKVVANDMAVLIFNERCEVNVSDDGFNDFVDQVLANNSFNTNFQNHLEYGLATGGIVLKPYVDNNEIRISYVTADSFVPISWDNAGIKEAVFIYETIRGKHKFTHLEWHTWKGTGENKKYAISNELYKADKGSSDIGVKVSLDNLFDDIEEEVFIDGVDKPLFVYIKPNTANNIDHKSPLGVPIYSHALDTIRLLDEMYDSYRREFKLGKRRIIVPATAVQTVMDENGAMTRYFDANDEVYQAMDLGNMDANKIADNTVEIRAEEHISSINAMLNLLAMQTGFSAGTWSFDGQGVKTATEVVSENSKTFRTKQSHEISVEAGVSELVDVIGMLADLYEIYNTPDNYTTSVKFDDSIAEDKSAEVTRETELVNNKLQSRKRAMMKIHGITDKEAEELIAEIDEESRSAIANSVDFFGLNRSDGGDNPTENQEDNGNMTRDQGEGVE